MSATKRGNRKVINNFVGILQMLMFQIDDTNPQSFHKTDITRKTNTLIYKLILTYSYLIWFTATCKTRISTNYFLDFLR